MASRYMTAPANNPKGGTPDMDPDNFLDSNEVKQFFKGLHDDRKTRKHTHAPEPEPEAADRITLSDFIERFKGPIAENIHNRFTPMYDVNSDTTLLDGQIAQLQTRRPGMTGPLFAAQAHITKAAKTLLNDNHGKCLFVIGEMGTGKTTISNALTHIMGRLATTNLIVCPPHLTQKWEREIRETFPMSTSLQVFQIKTITDFETARAQAHLYDKTFFVLSRERSKLSYFWKPDYIMKKKPVTVENTVIDEYGIGHKQKTVEMIAIPHCPKCHSMLVDERTGTAYEEKQLQGRRMFCRKEYVEMVQAPDNSFETIKRQCNTPLFTADRKGPRRYALADYIAKRHKNYFDILIVDEMHEMKAKGSAQGQVIGTLSGACKKTVALTGTIFGGRSSSLFYLLYRFSPAFKKQYTYNQETEFVKKYGIQWVISKESEIQTDGRSSKRKTSPTRIEEKPGISPEIILYLIDKAVFINLADIDDTLPVYTETPVECTMIPEQKARYVAVESSMRKNLAKSLARGDKRGLAKYLQTCLTYPDMPADDLVIYPHERSLIDLVKREKQAGRKVLCFCTHTDTRDVTPRLRDVLQREGLNVEVMKSTVKAEKREAWIKERVSLGLDVLICNPSLVKTGLDLIDFPTLYYYEIDFNIYTMRQSSRRSWRIGQTRPVQVYFSCYKDTMQQRALMLVAKKLKAAEMIDGELTEDGLSGYQDEGSLLMDLAKQMLGSMETDDNTLEGIFNAGRDAQREAKGFIGVQITVPEIVEPEAAPAPVKAVRTPRPQPTNDLWQTMYADKLAQVAAPKRTRKVEQPEVMLSLF